MNGTGTALGLLFVVPWTVWAGKVLNRGGHSMRSLAVACAPALVLLAACGTTLAILAVAS